MDSHKSSTPRLLGAAKLREMLSDKSKLIVAPGVYDGISARMALSVGCDALYMTGAGTSMSRLGWADLGLATQSEMVAQAEMLANLDPSVPLIADADTGYGGPIMVARTVRKYAQAGVAAFHIEDQVQEKRCGHLLGKEIVSREVYYSRLRAAVNARKDLGSDIVIIARTDSRQKYGFEEAYERLKGALEIGVDVVFPEAMLSKDESSEMVRRFKDTPCFLNMVPGGATPEISVAEARQIGYQIMIYPLLSSEAAILGIRSAMETLKNEGKMPEVKVGVREAFNLCGLQECMDLDQKAGGKAYDSV